MDAAVFPAPCPELCPGTRCISSGSCPRASRLSQLTGQQADSLHSLRTLLKRQDEVCVSPISSPYSTPTSTMISAAAITKLTSAVKGPLVLPDSVRLSSTLK